MAIPEYMSNNYETLLKAADAGHVALMECRRVDDGEVVYALCAADRDGEGNFCFTPFALMIDGNPFEMLVPPTEFEGTP